MEGKPKWILKQNEGDLKYIEEDQKPTKGDGRRTKEYCGRRTKGDTIKANEIRSLDQRRWKEIISISKEIRSQLKEMEGEPKEIIINSKEILIEP
jgi:hypothetical protein